MNCKNSWTELEEEKKHNSQELLHALHIRLSATIPVQKKLAVVLVCAAFGA